MNRNVWELENYARDFQRSRQQEAERGRRAEEAASGRRASVNGFDLNVARFFVLVKSWFSSGRTRQAPRPDRREEPESISPMPLATANGSPVRSVAKRRVASPYADMVVVAHGPAPMVEALDQPCGVRDC